jgi:hypothetical protein
MAEYSTPGAGSTVAYICKKAFWEKPNNSSPKPTKNIDFSMGNRWKSLIKKPFNEWLKFSLNNHYQSVVEKFHG